MIREYAINLLLVQFKISKHFLEQFITTYIITLLTIGGDLPASPIGALMLTDYANSIHKVNQGFS
jgi:hypothetical protein